MKGLGKKIASRFKRIRKKTDLIAAPAPVSESFPLLELSDDLILNILAFVSYAPLESAEESLFVDYISVPTGKKRRFQSFQARSQPAVAARSGQGSQSKLSTSCFGTLTHVLPLVCLRFQSLCQDSDGLWKDAMCRLAKKSPTVWVHGVVHLVSAPPEGALTSVSVVKEDESSKSEGESAHIVEEAVAHCDGGARVLFQRVVQVYQPFTTTAPLFLMGGNTEPPVLGQAWNLHLYEPRYRLMMSQIMQNRSSQDKNGGIIPNSRRPRFLFSSGITTPLMPGDPIFAVEIVRCKMKSDGRAMVSILPVAIGRMQSMQVRPNSFALLDATVYKTPFVASQSLLPVFCVAAMGRVPQLYASLELLIFEPRYRILIREVMESDHLSEQQRPHFILAYTGSVATGEAAMLVEVRKCAIRPDGAANVDLVPIAKGRLRDAVERPESDGLFDANMEFVEQ